jgi:Kef-type K+ transport system membrane component KefB
MDMRSVNILLGLTMVAFAAAQYNDPDALLWVVLYLVPAAWAFAAAFRLAQVRSTRGTTLLWITLAAGVAVVIYYWPAAPQFWRKDVWWADEEAREGMGLMIALLVLLFVVLTAFTARTRRS